MILEGFMIILGSLFFLLFFYFFLSLIHIIYVVIVGLIFLRFGIINIFNNEINLKFLLQEKRLGSLFI